MKIGSIFRARYQVLDYIASGGTSQVYLVKHLQLQLEMAMKIIEKSSNIDSLTEIETLKKLRHQQLPRVIDVIEDEKYLYIIRDYIAGETLEEFINKNGAMSFEQVLACGHSLLNVLDYLHSQSTSIIYRDLKPSNIIIDKNKQLYLIDFGTSRHYNPASSMDTISLGTRGYAAPEQYGGVQSDARTDYYALGATLYFLFTAEHYCDLSEELRFARFKNKSAMLLEKIILKAMAPVMDERYQTVDEFRRALQVPALKQTEAIDIKITKKVNNSSKITVGVMSIGRGLGSTTLALMLAKLTQINLGQTYYCSKVDDERILYLENFIEGFDYDENLKNNYFKYSSVHFMKNYDENEIDNLLTANNKSLIIDYGNHQYLFKDFLRNQYKFLLLPSQPWALSNIDFIQQVRQYEDLIFVFNLATKSQMKKMTAWLGLKHNKIVAIDYVVNPLNFCATHKILESYFDFEKKPSFLKRLGVAK